MFERTLNLIDQELTNTISSSDRDELMEQMMMDPSIADELHRRERLIHEQLQADIEVKRPSWFTLANAASLVMIAGAALLLAQYLNNSPQGLASANVYELDNVRSTSTQIPTVRIQTGEQWVNFMAYPDFSDFSSLDVRIDVRIDLLTNMPAEVLIADGGSWKPIWQGLSTVGNRDMLLLTVPGTDLKPGIHRLVVHGVVAGETTASPVHEVIFALEVGAD